MRVRLAGMPRWPGLLLPLVVAFAAPARAEMLTGAEIRAEFEGNTVSGTYVGGGPFTEYHARDGRALGDNGFTINEDACWNTDGDRVCYHYGQPKDRRTYCFTVERQDNWYWLRVAETGRLNAVAQIEKGNPSNHGDGGRRWSCDDLLSRKPGGAVFARLSRVPSRAAGAALPP